MTMHFKVIFWNATKLKIWPVVHVYMGLLRSLCYYRSGRCRALGLCVTKSGNLGMLSLRMREI